MCDCIYIIILNWNGWKDTIECLESVFRSEYPLFRVIVCDNYSFDNDLKRIHQWAEEMFMDDKRMNESDKKSCLIKKPLSVSCYNRYLAENGGNEKEDSGLILIQTGANLGFAGGNNVGIRYALKRNDFKYVWLLNNDTIIQPDTLTQLVNRMEKDPAIGICGSTLLYYSDPQKVQAHGGATYNSWLGIPKHIGIFKDKNELLDNEKIERKMDYVVGASMLVSKSFLNDIGLMGEEYFLYREELDWATRAKGKYKLGYAEGSIVYHKEGKSVGSSPDLKYKSLQSEYYSNLSTLKYACKFNSYRIWLILSLRLILKICYFIYKRQLRLLKPLFKAYRDFLIKR